MSNYLRDGRLDSLVLTEERFSELNNLLAEIVQNVNAALPAADPQRLQFAYIVRGDNKGSVLYDFGDALRCFREVRDVQRVVIAVTTNQNASAPFPGPLRVPFDGHGKCIFIWLSQDEMSHPQGLEFQPNIVLQVSMLTVTDDDRAWTEATFVRIKEQVDKYKSTANQIIRTPFIPVVIRLLLGLISFGFALVGALHFSSLFSSPEASTFMFVVFAYLLLVTVIPLIYPSLMRLINKLFPNIAFKASKTHWVIQAIIAAALGAILLGTLKFLYSSITVALLPYLSAGGQSFFK